MLRFLSYLIVLSSVLFGIENRIFVGIGTGFYGKLNSNFYQEIIKNNNTCEGGICIGGKTFGHYKGAFHSGLNFIFGNEAVLDSLNILGFRIYGGMGIAQATLGDLHYTKETKPRDKSFETIISNADGSLKIENVKMLSPKALQNFLFGNALLSTFSLNLDFFANMPMDYFFQKRWREFPFLKLGLFGGIGAEFALLKSPYWVNQSLYQNQEEALFASGGGLFFNLGFNLYATRKDRLDFGVKILAYPLKYESWHKVNETQNLWAEQLLKQTFDIKKDLELKITYVFYF